MAESINRDIATSISAAVKADTITSAGTISNAMTVVDSAGALPLSGNSAGDRAFVSGSNYYYIHNGSGWFNIALVNTDPSFTSIVDGFGDSVTTHVASTMSPSLLVENDSAYSMILTATDPEGIPVTFSATTDSNFSGFATLSQNNNTFTIDVKSDSLATTNEGSITFRATDGVNVATAVRSISKFFTIEDGYDTDTSGASHYTYANSGGGQSKAYNSTYGYIKFNGADNQNFNWYWEPGGPLPSSGWLWLNMKKTEDYPLDNNGGMSVGRRTYDGSSYTNYHQIFAGICGSNYQQQIYLSDDANATTYGATNVPYRWNTESSYVNFHLVWTPTSAKFYVNYTLNASTTWTTSQYDIAANGGLNYARLYGYQVDLQLSKLQVGSLSNLPNGITA